MKLSRRLVASSVASLILTAGCAAGATAQAQEETPVMIVEPEQDFTKRLLESIPGKRWLD